MLYLATASGPKVRDAMGAGVLGQMVTPDTGNRVVPGVPWALDNGCFAAQWTSETWLATLDKHKDTPGCLFAVVPDVVADAEATDVLWHRWAPAVSRRGYRCAYVAQNGCRRLPSTEAVFLGGDTAWKMGFEARDIAAAAKRSGCWLHMGRVNSLRRLRYAASLGCDSVDGTFLAFGPDVNLPRLVRYLRRADEPTLWSMT